ncbi:RHS repeat domain-containing protein [Usitatibacter palustris]|uniref:Deoxyribonuclease RhsC n=1 Tax=Usitatibacter palustris TaxID=2732487 RepID=A0A6M4H1L1_9PROT|nr:RHS repeat domain-containing protein [Usitatibacter palustris]QJR13340.1 Putative deoxyribonuclease RhsC [Usitatibacter palustris]
MRLSTYTYDSLGRVASSQRAGGENKYTFSYSTSGAVSTTSSTNAFGYAEQFEFQIVNDVLKLKKEMVSGAGQSTATFDGNGNPTSRTDRAGNVTNYVYDATRNLETSRTEGFGTAVARTITTTWHATHRLPATITEPSGVAGVNLVTEFTHDASGNVLKKKLTAGALTREWNYTYNAYGQVLTIDGPRTDVSDITTFTYFAASDTCVSCRGQIATATNAIGHVTSYVYNNDSRPSQITDSNGLVTTLAYTSRGWLESRTVGADVTQYTYDGNGNLIRVTLPDASWTSYAYDEANGLVEIADRAGNRIEYELDVYGNRVREKTFDPQSVLRGTLQRLYDAANRLHKEVGASGQTTEYIYNSNGLATTITDPNFNSTLNLYDAHSRLSWSRDPLQKYTNYTYDAKDHLKSVQDPKGLTTSYTYDGLGNLTQLASPDTGTTNYTPDSAGNVATQTDARSVTTSYVYDALNRVTAANVTDGTVTYEYDNLTTGGAYAKGRLTKVTDPSGSTAWTYDIQGRITAKTQTVTATPTNKSFAVGYAFASARPATMTYPSGRVVTYAYDVQGRVTGLTIDGSTILSGALYAPFGPAIKWSWGNAQAYERELDLDGRVASVTLGPSTGIYADMNQTFAYDVLSRLNAANLAAGQTQSYTYDFNGNRTNATVNAASTTYTYPGTSHKLSSLSGATTRSFTYDNAGNLTSSAGVTYVYDGRGRMKSAGSTAYLVNGLGQRVKKVSGADLFFVYDESGRLIGEYNASGAPIQEIVWFGDLPVAVLKPNGGTFDIYYVWADHLGSPRLISDTANGIRWEWAQADPFGSNAANENPTGLGAFNFNLRFPGQYYDVETGNHYNYFRDYDPRIGRYAQSDPIGLRGGPSTYAYVDGNALAVVDPFGLKGSGWGVLDWFKRRFLPDPAELPGMVLGEACAKFCMELNNRRRDRREVATEICNRLMPPSLLATPPGQSAMLECINTCVSISESTCEKKLAFNFCPLSAS